MPKSRKVKFQESYDNHESSDDNVVEEGYFLNPLLMGKQKKPEK